MPAERRTWYLCGAEPAPAITTPLDPDLQAKLRRINEARAGGVPPTHERLVEEACAPSNRLAVYGSLAPGRENHHVVAPLGGTWSPGVVRGHLYESGWGAGMGYPGFEWEPAGPEVEVQLLESEALTEAWPRLDAFEGPDYLRILVPVEVEGGEWVVASLYAIRR